jgi:enamine deaminase RidA (YjgF/YER057c/UK114 family)
MVYVSGQVPVGSDGTVVVGGIAEQTEQVLSNVKAVLALAGCTMDDVVKTTVWHRGCARFRYLQRRLRQAFSKGSAGPHHCRVATDDRHQDRGRGRRLHPALMGRPNGG